MTPPTKLLEKLQSAARRIAEPQICHAAEYQLLCKLKNQDELLKEVESVLSDIGSNSDPNTTWHSSESNRDDVQESLLAAQSQCLNRLVVVVDKLSSSEDGAAGSSSNFCQKAIALLLNYLQRYNTRSRCGGLERLRFSIMRAILQLGSGLGEDEYDLPRQLLQMDPSLCPEVCHYCTHTDKKGTGLVSILYASLSDVSLRHVVVYALADLPQISSEMEVLHRVRLLSEASLLFPVTHYKEAVLLAQAALNAALGLVTDTYWYEAATRVATALIGLVNLARKEFLSAYAPLSTMKTLAQVDPTILVPELCWVGLMALSSASIMEQDEALSVVDAVLTGYHRGILHSADVWSLMALFYPLQSLMTTSETPIASHTLFKLEDLLQCCDIHCGALSLSNPCSNDCPGRSHPTVTASYICLSMPHQLFSGKLIALWFVFALTASMLNPSAIVLERFLVISPCLSHRNANVRFSAVEAAVAACQSNPLVGVSIVPLLLKRIEEWTDDHSLRARCLREVCRAGRHRIVAKQIHNYIDRLESYQNPCNPIIFGLTVRMRCILANVNSWMIPQLEDALAHVSLGGGGKGSSSSFVEQASSFEFKAMRLAIAASLHEFCEFNAEAASDHIRLLQNGLSDPLPEVVHLCLEGLAAMVRQDCLDFPVVLRIVRKRGNVAHYDEKSGVVHLLIVEGLAHLCWAAEEAWTTIEEADQENVQYSISPHTFDVISWLWELVALLERKQDDGELNCGTEYHHTVKCCFDALGLYCIRVIRVSELEGKDDECAQLQDVHSEMTRKMLQYLYNNCRFISCTQRMDILSLTEVLGNMVDIECDNVKTHFRLSTSAAQPPTKGFSSGLPLVGEGMDGGGMPSSERLLKAYDDASASEQCNSMAGAVMWCCDRRSMTYFSDFIVDESKAFMRQSPYCVKLMIITGVIRYTESWWDAEENDRNAEVCLEELEHLEKGPLVCLSQAVLACHLESVHNKLARLKAIMKRIPSVTDDREPITEEEVFFGWDCLDPICAALIAASLPVGHGAVQSDVRLLLQHQCTVNNQGIWYCVGIGLLAVCQSKSNPDSRLAIICCGELLALVFSDDDAAARKDFQEEWLKSTPDITRLLEVLRCSSPTNASLAKEEKGKRFSIISPGIEIISWALPVFHRKLLLSLLRAFLTYPGVSCIAQTLSHLSLMCGEDDAPPSTTLLNEVYNSHTGDKFVGLALLAAADLQSQEGNMASAAVRNAAQSTEAGDEFDLAALSLAVLCCGSEATWSGALFSFFVGTSASLTSPMVAPQSFIQGVVRNAQTISSRHLSRSRRGMAWRSMGCIAPSIAVSVGGVSSSSSSSMHHVESYSKRGLKLNLPAKETLSCQLLEIVFSSVEEMGHKRIQGIDYKYMFPAVTIAMKSLSRGADRLRTSTSAMVKLLDNLMKLIEGMSGDLEEEEAVLHTIFEFAQESAKRRDGSPFVSWLQALLPPKCLKQHPQHKELLIRLLPNMIYSAFPTNSIFSALNVLWEDIRNDPMAAAVLAFSRGLVDTMIISSQSKGQNNNNKDSSLLRDFSFTVMSVVLSTQGLSTLDCLLALPMEDWSFVFAKLTDDDTAMEARLLLKAAGQGFWWRQGMDRMLRWLTSSSPEASQYINELCPMLTQAILKTWTKDADEVKRALLIILEGEKPSRALSAFVKSWSLDALLADTDHRQQQHDDVGVCTELAAIDCDDIDGKLVSKALRCLGLADPTLRSQMRRIVIGLSHNVSSDYSSCFSSGCLSLLKDQCCCNNGP